jgi:hypothetical protein
MARRVPGKNGGSIVLREKGDPVLPGAGRPKKLPDSAEKLFEEFMLDVKEGESRTAIERMVMMLRKKAVAGDLKAMEMILDRIYGKPKQDVNVTKTERQIIIIGGQRIEF